MPDYISREAAVRAIDVPNVYHGIIAPLQEVLCDIPAADVAPVVRCWECKFIHLGWCMNEDSICYCGKVTSNWYCADGKRKEDE